MIVIIFNFLINSEISVPSSLVGFQMFSGLVTYDLTNEKYRIRLCRWMSECGKKNVTI